jgi:putative flippase GtrA
MGIGSRWLFVGLATFLIDTTLYLFSRTRLGLEISVANLVSMTVAIVFNHRFHRSWTFGNRDSYEVRQSIRYIAQFIFTWILSTIIILTLTPITGNLLAKVAGVALTAPIGFLLLQRWVFKAK